MRLSLLGSGSLGNVAYLEAGQGCARTRILIDAGLSKSEIIRRLARCLPPSLRARPLDSIGAVLVTHDHSDHAGCAAALNRPIYATAGTTRVRSLDRGDAEVGRVRAGVEFAVGAFTVLPVLLPHDADETVGYVLDDGSTRVGILTDCGHDAPEVAAGYVGCHVLILEANHDPSLLANGPYPASLKRRVGGQRGHLSNDQAARLLTTLCRLGPPPRLVIAAHLSMRNNRPILARSALERAVSSSPRTAVHIASQEGGTPLIDIEGSTVTFDARLAGQLAFDFEPRQGAWFS